MTGPVPAEWSPHRAMWLGFPSHAALWKDDLDAAQDEVAALAVALAGAGGERVRLLAQAEGAKAASDRLAGTPGIEIIPAEFGDIWLRDTGPIFLTPGTAAAFAFNGWGGKYRLAGDETVADQIAIAASADLVRHPFVLEGGALDHDGAGACLTTRQCLTNPNRNRRWREADAEQALAGALGVRKVIWLGDGLVNDHTDGHVDNLARFVAPGVACCPMAFGADDPNAAVYDAAAATLARSTDAGDRRLTVVRIPSPGRLIDADHRSVPGSHMNFLIANRAVVVPIYNERAGELAMEALQMQFPDRSIIGLSARSLITGGGGFHCISQHEPA
ncbi:MAG TPA: agmatine deiminase family protein [Caulobacteraceae bacterium]